MLGLLIAAELFLLPREQGVDGRVELVTALEEIELEDEDVFEDLATELLDEGARCSCRATCGRLACCCAKCSFSVD